MLSTRIHSQAKRLGGVVTLAGLCLALVAPAAQARPVGLVPNGTNGWTDVQTTSQATPPPVRVITTTQDSGFSWTDAAIGAGLATGVLVLARVAISRPRPHLSA